MLSVLKNLNGVYHFAEQKAKIVHYKTQKNGDCGRRFGLPVLCLPACLPVRNTQTGNAQAGGSTQTGLEEPHLGREKGRTLRSNRIVINVL
ncbi:MAG: hypothetical protein A3C07_05260 [Candidatus Sungbacteria bacterium RIFCSPHIGHO2_02_FULL_47_11]|uniref:Uncharacterized protein n=1 Tax=Candidatus Sungbacteria bacterium RIFCSPHIGHO2_02_FULL_47_11 TaxID=1802270 RepID=A0A1G2KNL4_9BACT|nr:MAG: hypothetical protein A3C07_05260 [Candidatus Sungbacteria bacterium RIFCSPHIGHO2_02_FULL_47_11]